ncbi:hypothetical protein G6F24_014009 [Rhizopus arrhizus]|nr:hypothetical protein G6F24_014009 [Rhizopus arrhizus]
MGEDVQQPSERIAHEEAAHAPGFIGRAVLQRDAGRAHALQHVLQIVHLDRQVRHCGAGAAFTGKTDLRQGIALPAVSDDPAVVHHHRHAEQVAIEGGGALRIGRGDVGNDAPDSHGISLSRKTHREYRIDASVTPCNRRAPSMTGLQAA